MESITPSLIFFTLASVCNAIMDIIKYKINKSIFLDLNYKVFAWFMSYYECKNHYFLNMDGWHTFKALMITFLILATITFPNNYLSILGIPYLFILYAIIWGVGFNASYYIIFIKKEFQSEFLNKLGIR